MTRAEIGPAIRRPASEALRASVGAGAGPAIDPFRVDNGKPPAVSSPESLSILGIFEEVPRSEETQAAVTTKTTNNINGIVNS